MELEEVLCALYRVLECAVGLVDARRPLQRRAALGVAGVREAVGMHARLDLAVGAIERLALQGIRGREAEEIEMAMHGRCIDASRAPVHVSPCIGWSRERRAIS